MSESRSENTLHATSVILPVCCIHWKGGARLASKARSLNV